MGGFLNKKKKPSAVHFKEQFSISIYTNNCCTDAINSPYCTGNTDKATQANVEAAAPRSKAPRMLSFNFLSAFLYSPPSSVPLGGQSNCVCPHASLLS